MELRCVVKNYDWGQLGTNSLVARLAERNDTRFVAEANTPYAELWMGTHPNGESVVKIKDISLSEVIKQNPSYLGLSVNTFGADLSFLLKVLSIRKALSIQVHPDKEFAKKLHTQFPKMYTDDNHKPELAVALTDFEALCGFRPLEEILLFLQSIPELCHLIDPDCCHNFLKRPSVKLLEKCFASYITASPVEARKCAAQLIDRLSASDFKIKEAQLGDFFNKLNEQFPGDIGLFSIYFLNHVHLKPGEAIYLDAGLPHAYISGDCVEVMARSDNVVRAGLTPKVRDVSTLLEIVKVEPISQDDIKFKGCIFDKYVYHFKPPIPDFALSRINVPKKDTYTLPALRSASILLIIKGSAECDAYLIETGVVLFIPSGQIINFTVTEDLEMYQAYPNL